jgi:hypothetical protein
VKVNGKRRLTNMAASLTPVVAINQCSATADAAKVAATTTSAQCAANASASNGQIEEMSMIEEQSLIAAVRAEWDKLQHEGVVLTGDDYIRAAIAAMWPLMREKFAETAYAEACREKRPGQIADAIRELEPPK